MLPSEVPRHLLHPQRLRQPRNQLLMQLLWEATEMRLLLRDLFLFPLLRALHPQDRLLQGAPATMVLLLQDSEQEA